jgi:hypothetical protein
MIAILLAGCGRLGFDATGDEVADDQPDDMADDLPGDDGPGDDGGPMFDAAIGCGSGHDEDGDEFADDCDRCPHVSTLLNADRDNDGVGDDCDPQPDVAAQSIARFDAFASLPADWAQSGTVVKLDDAIRLSGGASSISRPWANGTSLFMIGFTVSAIASDEALLALIVGEGGTPRIYYCELYDDATSMLLQLTYTLNGADYIHPGLQSTAERLSDLSGTLAMSTDTSKSCRAVLPSGAVGAEGTVGGITPDFFTLYAQNAMATIDWMIEIRTDP